MSEKPYVYKKRDWGEQLIISSSLGISEKEFWKMTPFQFYIRVEAQKERVKLDNVVNLHLLNVVSNVMNSGKPISITYDDIFGIEQLKDYNLLTRLDFGTREEFDEYINDVVEPLRKRLGVE